MGTTIYPGMQYTAVFIKKYIVGDSMSLNDVCCYIPAWFGVIATILVGMITYECSLECNANTHIFKAIMDIFSKNKRTNNKKENKNQWKIAVTCAVFATAIMAIVPAHLMRSVGGGFDNECVAISTMLLTFYCWVRSLREGDETSYLFGILTGVAYFYVSFKMLLNT